MICLVCGTQNVEGTVYCRSCGSRLRANQWTYVGDALVSQDKPAPPFATHARTEDERAKLGELKSPADSPGTRPPAPGSNSARMLGKLAGLVPTHELIRMANGLGVDVDYSTLRFWQKRGLLPKPVRGPVEGSRGTRGYYNPALIERLRFIRRLQKDLALGLGEICEELKRVEWVAKTERLELPTLYQKRLDYLRQQREGQSRKKMLDSLSNVLGVEPDQVNSISVKLNNGQTILISANGGSTPPTR